jgi:predicted hotdog family 3-hydroxylacyl-ACP dehydratase
MKPCPYAVAELLPHRPPLILLDRVVGYDDASLVAEVEITERSLFRDSEGVPSHVGIEYMAQACAAYVGLLAKTAGGSVKIGFLLGTRDFKAHAPWFRVGQTLAVTVAILFRDEQMGAFACRIEADANLLTKATLNVYQTDMDGLASGIEGATA